MITFDKDGVTLIGYDASGNKFTHNYLEGDPYDIMLSTLNAQQQAARDNATAVDAYNTALATAQLNENAGRPHDAPPVAPQQKIVTDLGVVSYAPFVPALAAFVPLVSTPSGRLVAPAPPDPNAVMRTQVNLIFHKLFPDA
jgi:hypothetical protein